MAHFIEHILRKADAKLRAHACRWQALDEITIESAACTDEQVQKWSESMYAKDFGEWK